MATLTQDEVAQALGELDGWEQNGAEIRKEYSFTDFGLAMEFVNHVARAAEAANHHPDIDIRYNKVTLALSTHSEGGLTAKDVELAQRIEEMTS